MSGDLSQSVALWNRNALVIESDEVVAQILDRGTADDWRALYRLAATDPRLRRRIHRLVLSVPLPLPRFWLSALIAIGEPADLTAPVPDYFEHTGI